MDETNPQDRIEAAKEHARQSVDDLHSAAKAKAAEFQNVAEDAWSDAQSRTQAWQTEVETFIRQNPTKAVCMALGLGFVLTRMLRK
jgi:ElaB/YqjD/DUF883 family membrane-anchored ribosome-binding protein